MSQLISFQPKVNVFYRKNKFTKGSRGLLLKVGVIVVLASGLLFTLVAVNVLSGNQLTIVDAQIAQWLHANSTPALTQCMLILTHMYDPITLCFMVALIASYLIWKKRWYELWAIILVVPGGMLLNLLVKQAFHRVRPNFEEPLVMLTTYSFPSGHVAATTLFYGAIAALLISQTTKWSRAAYFLLLAFFMVVLVAISRIYLGAHYLSDVLAAFLEAIAWLALCLTAIHTYRGYKETK